jgi:hypothetical protein
MNQTFLEERSKEKVKNVLDEGMRSQEYYRNRTRKPNPIQQLGKIILFSFETLIHNPFRGEKHPVDSHSRS